MENTNKQVVSQHSGERVTETQRSRKEILEVYERLNPSHFIAEENRQIAGVCRSLLKWVLKIPAEDEDLALPISLEGIWEAN